MHIAAHRKCYRRNETEKFRTGVKVAAGVGVGGGLLDLETGSVPRPRLRTFPKPADDGGVGGQLDNPVIAINTAHPPPRQSLQHLSHQFYRRAVPGPDRQLVWTETLTIGTVGGKSNRWCESESRRWSKGRRKCKLRCAGHHGSQGGIYCHFSESCLGGLSGSNDLSHLSLNGNWLDPEC